MSLASMEWGTPHLGLRQENPIDQIDMSYLPWARGTDMRILKESQIEGGRIRIKPGKTQKTVAKLSISPSCLSLPK